MAMSTAGPTQEEDMDTNIVSSTVHIVSVNDQFGPAKINDPPMLPPCKVCGNAASGIHYGVITCEPCKAFFKRSLDRSAKKKEGYICIGTGDCKIEPGIKKLCGFCRYEKCLALGMSKEASKHGRYTLDKKSKIIKEVKDMERKAKENTKIGESVIDEIEAENIISILTQTMRLSLPHIQMYLDNPEAAVRMEQKIKEEYEERIRLFGSMATLPQEVYDEILNATGLEIDNRQELINKMVEKFDGIIKGIAIFIGYIPGFESLRVEDHTALVKGNYLDFKLLSYYRGTDYSSEVCSCLSVHRKELEKIFPETLLNSIFNKLQKINQLQITEEEFGLILAITATFSDRCTLIEREKVEQIHLKLFNCLRYLSLKNQVNPDIRTRQIVDLLTYLRNHDEDLQEANRRIISFSAVQKHPFLIEFMDTGV